MRINFFDNLRGFSIAIVLIYHFFGEGILAYGNLGVLIFFIVSGYCIALSIDKSISPFHFYTKRIGRLFPALFVCGFITTFVKINFPYLLAERPVDWTDPFLTPIDFATLGFFPLHFHYPDGSYWSLVIEFQFYALVAILMVKYNKNDLLGRLCLITIALPVFQILFDWRHPPQMAYFLPFFLAGFSLKYLADNNKNQIALSALFLSFLTYIFFVLIDFKTNSLPSSIAGFITLVTISFLILFIQFTKQKNKFYINKLSFLILPFKHLGIISYPLYLLHQDIGNTILFLFNANCLDGAHECVRDTVYYRLLLVPISMIFLAWAVYYFIERRSIKKCTNLLYNLGCRLQYKKMYLIMIFFSIGILMRILQIIL